MLSVTPSKSWQFLDWIFPILARRSLVGRSFKQIALGSEKSRWGLFFSYLVLRRIGGPSQSLLVWVITAFIKFMKLSSMEGAKVWGNLSPATYATCTGTSGKPG